MEEWRPVPGYEELYEVSDHGRVRSLYRIDSLGRKHLGKIRAQPVTKKGYLVVGLTDGKRRRQFRVHRLVAEVFIGPCPMGQEACHNDGDKTNNHVSNIRYDTHKSNIKDKTLHGTQQIGERGPTARLKEEDVRHIRRVFNGDRKSLSEKFGISRNHVYSVAKGYCWKHI